MKTQLYILILYFLGVSSSQETTALLDPDRFCLQTDFSRILVFPKFRDIYESVTLQDYESLYNYFYPCENSVHFPDLIQTIVYTVFNVETFSKIHSKNSTMLYFDMNNENDTTEHIPYGVDFKFNFELYTAYFDYVSKHYLIHERHCDKMIVMLYYITSLLDQFAFIDHKENLLSYLLEDYYNPIYENQFLNLFGDRFDDWKSSNFFGSNRTYTF
ncbi:hypothetical protein [Carp edema virus]|nr:hypothetical protein [Carp edema virus]